MKFFSPALRYFIKASHAAKHLVSLIRGIAPCEIMVFLIMFLVMANFVSAEEVRLKSGVVKKGEIIERTGQDITIKDGGR